MAIAMHGLEDFTHEVGDSTDSGDPTSTSPCRTFFVGPPSTTAATNVANINSAITQASAAGGGTVCFQPGTYTVNATISLSGLKNITLRGAGRKATNLLCNVAAAHVIDIDVSGTTQSEYINIENMAIGHSVAQTAGYASIHVRGAFTVTVTNVTSYGALIARFVWVEGTAYTGVPPAGMVGAGQFTFKMQDFLISSCTEAGIYLGNDTVTLYEWVQGAFISDGVVGSCPVGIDIRHASGVYINSVDVIDSTGVATASMQIAPTTPRAVQAIFMDEVTLDTPGLGPCLSVSGTGYVRHCGFNNVWFASSVVGAGILINNDYFVENSFVGCQILNNDHEGLRIVKTGARNLFCGNMVVGNSQELTNTYDGVYIAANYGGWNFTGNRIGDRAGVAASHRWGIYTAAGTGDSIGIVSNDLAGNVTGAISDNATGQLKRISNNIGELVNRNTPITLAAGDNDNVVIVKRGDVLYAEVTGPAGPYAITGVVPAADADGQLLIIRNGVAQTLTIKHDVTSTAANRFYTKTGVDVAVGAINTSAIAIYSQTVSRWILLNP